MTTTHRAIAEHVASREDLSWEAMAITHALLEVADAIRDATGAIVCPEHGSDCLFFGENEQRFCTDCEWTP